MTRLRPGTWQVPVRKRVFTRSAGRRIGPFTSGGMPEQGVASGRRGPSYGGRGQHAAASFSCAVTVSVQERQKGRLLCGRGASPLIWLSAGAGELHQAVFPLEKSGCRTGGNRFARHGKVRRRVVSGRCRSAVRCLAASGGHCVRRLPLPARGVRFRAQLKRGSVSGGARQDRGRN